MSGLALMPHSWAAVRTRLGIRALLLILAASLSAGGLKGSKHDLSSTANAGSSQICMFCHTPHNANNTLGTAFVPLWNRYVDTSKVFTIYSSSSLINQPGDPSKSGSAACLGCHDGTIGHNAVYGTDGSDKHALINGPNGLQDKSYSLSCAKCHTLHHGGDMLPGTLKLGTNLSNMHPISISYPTASQSSEFRVPTDSKTGWSDVKLFNGKVECGSCHAVHDPTHPPFLRKSNEGSALCLSCHIK